MINGIKYDWESVEITGPGGLMVGCTDINYKEEKQIEARYGKGSVPRGYGRKNYSASGDATLDRDEYERFRSGLGDPMYMAQPCAITVRYANNDQDEIVDTLPNCKFTAVETGAAQDSANVGQAKLSFTILEPIKWNGSPNYEES